MTTRRKSPGAGLPVINPRAAAIDVGSRFHVVAVAPELSDQPVQTFQAFTDDLQRMARWLKALGIATVAMESTGVTGSLCTRYSRSAASKSWWPMPATRDPCPAASDVNDAQWLQRLHACGLLHGSFRPQREIAELRAYLRLRERHLDYAASHIQHMQKALTFMNLQLHHVVSDVTGGTGLRIVRAIVAGERDPKVKPRTRRPALCS